MDIQNLIKGLQHIGIPTTDISKTVQFYKSLGFDLAYCSRDETDTQVAFLKQQNLVIETYQVEDASGNAGPIDHIAIDVKDIRQVFEKIQKASFKILESKISFLPFWEKGVEFFTIEGPNGEKIEFNQIL